MKPFLTALLVVASLLFSSVSSRAQIPILAGAYRDNPLKLTYTFVGLYQKPVITAVAKKDANGLPLAANLQPKVTTTPDPVVPGVYAVVVGYDTTSSLPINSWLEIKLNGQVFAAGPVTIDRTNRSGSYAVFVNTVTLITTSGLNTGNGNSGGGIDLTQVTNLLKDKVDKVTGKDLSTNDFTDVYRNKLDTLRGAAGGVTQSFADARYRLVSDPVSYSNLTGKPAIPTIPTSLTAFSNEPGYQTSAQVGAAIGNATNPLSQSISQQAADIAGKLSSSTYTTNRTADQAATTAAQNGANTALTTANSATAAASANATQISSLSGTVGGKVDKSTTITVNGVSQPLSGPVSFSISGTNSTTLTQVSQLSNDANYQNGSQVGAALTSAINSVTTAQQTTDNNQTLSISQKLPTTTFNSFTTTQGAVDAGQSSSIAQNASDLAGKLSASTYTSNRSTDQSATTTAQNTANTALTTANSATATGASNGSAISALQSAGYQTAGQVATAVSSGTASAAASQTATDNAQNAQINARLTSATFGSFTTTQQQTDQQQNTTISSVSATANQAQTTAANNTTAIAGKQPLITSSTSFTAGSVVVNALTAGDSLSNKVPTMKDVRDFVNLKMPTFIDFPYDTAYFSFDGQLSPKPAKFRGLYTAGVGVSIVNGVISSTVTGGSSTTNVVTATDPNNTGSTATFLLPPANGGRVFIGNASLQPYALNLRYVSGVEAMPGFKSNAGNLGFGLDADATVWRINNVVSFNSSSNGTGTDNGYKFYGSPTRYMQINEANGDKAPLLVRITTDGKVGIGIEAPTANLHVIGSAIVTGAIATADATVNGNLVIPTANDRYFGFDGLAAGQTVRLRLGDPTGGIDVTSGQPLVFKGYHGTVLQNQSGGTGPGLRVNGLASNRNISEYYDASGTLRASMSQAGQLTANGGIKFGDGTTLTTAPTGGGSSVTTFASTLSELAAATTRLVVYDGSTWVRVSGTVESNVGSNVVYTVTQYNSGSDHYERQFPGRAKFEWWRNSASNTWEQMKYAANSQLDVQVANGDYSFNERVYISPGTHIFGNETSPDSVRFHINGPNPYLFMNWPWMDGTNGMQGPYRKKAENIVLAGFTLYNESSYVAKKDTNDFYGPISIDGGGSFNNVIRNIKYKQVSSTAIVNVILVKMGTQKVCESLLIDNVQSLTSTVKGRMLVEVLNQGDGSNSPERVQVPARGVEVRNCVADGFRFGISVAGNFLKPYVHHNIARNCTDYGVEFAGPLVDGRCEYNGFGGTQNVLIAANYVAGTAADWVFPAGSGQRYVGNYTEGKVSGGYVEIRSGGVIDFSDNNFQIDGGIYLQQTTVAGVRGGQFTRNRIVSTLTNANWRNTTTNLVYLNGASGVHFSNNYLERGGTDASAMVQSNDNGVSSVVNYYYNNALKTGTNGTYWGNANTTGVRWSNFDITGTARN